MTIPSIMLPFSRRNHVQSSFVITLSMACFADGVYVKIMSDIVTSGVIIFFGFITAIAAVFGTNARECAVVHGDSNRIPSQLLNWIFPHSCG